MPGVLFTQLQDLKPIITCRLAAPGAAARPPEFGISVRALIDTGATDVVVRDGLFDMLALPEAEAVYSVNVGYSGAHRAGFCDVIFPCRKLLYPDEAFTYSVTGARVFCSDFVDGCDAIIGMNVLRFLDMRFTPDGCVEIRTP